MKFVIGGERNSFTNEYRSPTPCVEPVDSETF